jgi:general L-amino acid transport system substrate-binding protein
MKKRMNLIVGMLILALGLVACGGDSGDSEALQGQVNDLTQQLADANAALAEAQAAAAEAASGSATSAEPIEFAGGGNTLETVRARGELICGTPQGVSPGFGFIEEDGSYTGFDWEYCRVVAAAVFGDADAVVSRPSTSTERFPILQSGEVDMLSRQTTWTTTRDTQLGFNFGPTTFYDGQGMMVRKASGITDLQGLEGGTVCVAAGTTTELNLASVMSSLGINYEPVVFEGDGARIAYDEERCDGYTTDKSGLVSGQVIMTTPSDHTILAVTMSKEPLGPLVRHGDDNWFDIVQWSTFCTFQAEEKGVTSQNVDEMLGSDDPEILSLLGVEGDLGSNMGLSNDFCYQIIKQVGNYEEIYMANLGPDTPFNLPRGVNALWTDGGLLYSPPFR